LKPNGRMVLQGITIVDHRYQDYLKQVDFIREYIFPGGCLISTSGVMNSVAKETDFRLVHIEDIGLHYAETLRRWRTEFHRHWEQISLMGFDAKFFRLWDYYLAYCEAGFSEGHVGTIQIVLDRPQMMDPLSMGLAFGTR
jgi:cyclopropane-fatty-acyl-phospholipid synthase